MIRSSPGLTLALVSSPAKADDPVFREAQVQQRPSRNTGSPPYAGYVALTFILPPLPAKGTPTPRLRFAPAPNTTRGEKNFLTIVFLVLLQCVAQRESVRFTPGCT